MNERPVASDRGLFAHATGLFIRGDYFAASEAFQGVEEKFPQSEFAAKAKLRRAKCAVEIGDFPGAATICDKLLADHPQGIKYEELVTFTMEVARKLKGSHPWRSAELLRHLAATAPQGRLQYLALMEQGSVAFHQGDHDLARSCYEKSVEIAPDAKARHEAIFQAAVNDVAASRERGRDAGLLRKAETEFRDLLRASPTGNHAKDAQEFLDLLDSLLKEADPDRQEVYYAATRLHDPEYRDGVSLFRRAAKKYRGSLVGETARFYQAECLYRRGEPWSAFKIFEQFLKEYPASKRLRVVVEREFAIGQALAEQGKQSDAVGVMEAVAHNGSNGPLADDALMFVGRAQLEWGQFDDAKATFDLLAQGYPKSKWNRAAIFQGGVADLRHGEFATDREALLDRARRAFEVCLRDEPSGPLADEAKKLLRDCRERQARILMEVAHFYERRREQKAAGVYYQAVLSEHPESSFSGAAKSALEQRGEPGGNAP